MALNYYLEVTAPSTGSLNDILAAVGVNSRASEGGRMGYEIHYWTSYDAADAAATRLTEAGYPARVETRSA